MDDDIMDAGDAGPGSGCFLFLINCSYIIGFLALGFYLLVMLLNLVDAFLLPKFTDFRIIEGILSLLK